MSYSMAFLMAPGRPVPQQVIRKLYNTAKDMAKSRRRRQKFEVEDYCGILNTTWKTSNMGTISGIEFRAEMQTPTGDVVTTFLVRSYDLEDEEYVPTYIPSLADAEQVIAEHERPSRLN